MNFLAHSYLSPSIPLVRLGNTFGDFIKGKAMLGVHPDVVKGVLLHREIDTFTDNHPITQECKKIFINQLGLFSGIVVDMVYDHFLAKNWSKYSSIELKDYAKELFNDFDNQHDNLPEKVCEVVPIMKAQNWILAYETVNGMEKILKKMSQRISNKKDLTVGIPLLIVHEKLIESMFFEFFESAKTRFC